MAERDRLNLSLRTHENDLHAMEKQETALSNQMRDKDITEERISTMTKEITILSAKLKVSGSLLRKGYDSRRGRKERVRSQRQRDPLDTSNKNISVHRVN